jgi:SAM-dependent methyltransferase
MQNFFTDNQAHWDERVAIHVASDFYFVNAWRNGKTSLNSIELKALADKVAGKKLLHLQCHFGQDTLSWARLGADCVGVDFSAQAIAQARELNVAEGANVRFVESSIYDLPQNLAAEEQFDVVFLSYGTIGWLPDLDKYLAIVAQYLRKGGIFYIVDFHPMLWTLDDETYSHIYYSYFNDAVITEEVEGTYADRNATIKAKNHSWNHPFCDILGAILRNGLTLQHFNEYRYSPYACFRNMEWRDDLGGYVFPQHAGKIPLLYEIMAVR